MGRLFTMYRSGEDEVIALDAETGRPRGTQVSHTLLSEAPNSTPTIAGDRLYRSVFPVC
jgi:hypothetical protein